MDKKRTRTLWGVYNPSFWDGVIWVCFEDSGLEPNFQSVAMCISPGDNLAPLRDELWTFVLSALALGNFEKEVVV